MALKQFARLFTCVFIMSLGLSLNSCIQDELPPEDNVENPGDNGDNGNNGDNEDTVPDNPYKEYLDKGTEPPGQGTAIWWTPSLPDADGPLTISCRAGEDSPLYGYEGEVYVHIGVIEYGVWQYVKAEWLENIPDCKFFRDANKKNVWHLPLGPSVREYFQSGTTPCEEIGIVIRKADGSAKLVPEDRFIPVADNKYKGFEAEIVTETKPVPANCTYGINVIDDRTVTFVLHDEDTKGEHHDFAFIIGDFNEWTLANDESSRMNRDDDKDCWWITVSGLDPQKEYRYQYHIGDRGENGDVTFRMADAFCEKVLDPDNDKWIPSSTYDENMEYPARGGAGLLSVVKTTRDSYSWQVPDFDTPDADDIVIYEMLFRDFSLTKDINGALAQLDYIEKLGVTAVELMPVQEFDGNNSWGYSPCFYFALDKAYGTRNMYKQFIDECHKRGIAVIVDVVYNHNTGASPLAKIYWDGANNRTAANNPYFNAVATHPFNVYHDLNHENAFVKELVKRSTQYLLEEYKIDGFRFDLTKGFTQNNTGNDDSACQRYDQSRIDILKGYADHIWSVDSDAIVILEHFTEGSEEQALANHGMKIWRNVNHTYHEAMKGGAGNFGGMYSTSPFGGFVGYMESHDEERICVGAIKESVSTGTIQYGVIGLGDKWQATDDKIMTVDGPFLVAKNLEMAADDRFKIRKAGVWDDNYNYGAAQTGKDFYLTVGQSYAMTNGSSSQDMYVSAAGTYDVYFCPEIQTVWLMKAGSRPEEPALSTDDPLTVAMRRAGACAAFSLLVPGPKMIWQFGEIGYDISIDFNDRVGEKPVKTAEYMAMPARKGLYDTYSALLKFRKDNPRFFDSDAQFSWTPGNTIKKITCTVDGKSFHVVGNFTNEPQKYTANEPAKAWKDYFTKQDATAEFTLKAGEFRLLTDF